MDRITIDNVHNCLEILRVSGDIVLYIDDKPPVQTKINRDLRIFFYLKDKKQTSTVNKSSERLPIKTVSNMDESQHKDQQMVSDGILDCSNETGLDDDSSFNQDNHDPVVKEEVSDSDIDAQDESTSISHLNSSNEDSDATEKNTCILTNSNDEQNPGKSERKNEDIDATEENTSLSHLNLSNEEQNPGKSERKDESNESENDGHFRLYRPKPCSYCGKEFETSAEKEQHNLSSLPTYTCTLCKIEFSCQANLLIHEHYRHSENKVKDLRKENKKFYSHCPVCKKQVQKCALFDHISFNHTKEMKYKCCICGTPCYTRRQLNKHARVHLNPEENKRRRGQWKCSLCPEVFHDKGQFHKHSYTHRTKCVFCDEELGHKQFLDLHYQKEHADRMFTCHICGKQMATQVQHATHVRHHRYKRLIPCPVCGVMITNKFLPCHMEVKHPEQAAGLTRETNLTSDIDVNDQTATTSFNNNAEATSSTASPTPDKSSSVTTPENLFLCVYCPRTFPFKRYLNQHMYRFHSTEGKLSCPQCDKKLLNKSMLNRHIRNVHLKSKIYTCEICGKQCTVKTNLKIHMRVHSDVKFFTCMICNQGFNYKASLRSHMRSKHYTDFLD